MPACAGTMIYTLDDDAKLRPYCQLTKGCGDCAYPEAVRVGDEMLVSYHHQDEGPANIYVARVPVRGKQGAGKKCLRGFPHKNQAIWIG